LYSFVFHSFHTPPPPQLSPLSLHDALPISFRNGRSRPYLRPVSDARGGGQFYDDISPRFRWHEEWDGPTLRASETAGDVVVELSDRKSTRLNSSHVSISYAVFCLKKKKHD